MHVQIWRLNVQWDVEHIWKKSKQLLSKLGIYIIIKTCFLKIENSEQLSIAFDSTQQQCSFLQQFFL